MADLFLGVDIGSKYVKVVALEHGVKLRLEEGFLFPVPLKITRDGNKQIDPDAFIKEMTSFFPMAKLHHAKIAINLPPMSITALSVFLPLMSRKELAYAAVNEAKQKMIPPAGPNHIFDCLFMGENMVNKIPRAEVQVIRTEKFYVQVLLDLFKSAGVYPLLISPACTIMSNVVPREAWKKEEAVVIVDIGAAYLKIAIYSDTKMVFVRNIAFGMEDITQDFARQLNINVAGVEAVIKEHGVPLIPFDSKDKVAIAEEIMRQKYEASLNSSEGAENQINLLELRLLWQPHIDRIIQELRRSFVFYNERSEGRRIEQVFFSGGGSYVKNLRPSLSSSVGGECKELFAFTGIPHELPKDNKFKEEIVSSAIFASAASLALGLCAKKEAKDGHKVNFLPVEFKQREAMAARRLAVLITGICFVSFFLLGSIQLFFRNQMVKGAIRTTAQKLNQIKRVSDNLKELEESESKIKRRSQLVEDLIRKRPDFILPFEGIAKILPKDIVLTKCVLDLNKVEIEGKVFTDYEEAARLVNLFKKELVKNKIFNNVVVSPIELEGFSPELVSQGTAQGELRLTQPKERSFKLSMDITVPQVAAVLASNKEEVEKLVDIDQARETGTDKEAGNNPRDKKYKSSSDVSRRPKIAVKNSSGGAGKKNKSGDKDDDIN